jgi:energy-coupling factor transport system ATP-binding protein
MEDSKNNLPIIMFNHLDYVYPDGSVALQDISINIHKGELIGIMGQNGAGKTTLIRTLNGLIRPQNGDIYIKGKNIKTQSIGKLSKFIGIVFQNPSHQLFSNTVAEEINFSLKNLNLTKDEKEQRKDMIIQKFNFEKYRDRSPLNLSGGEKKKLAIASIFCRDPEIIVFDEPTLGQDAKEIEFFLSLIKEERKREKTILIVTHNIEFALKYIPRIIIMSKGRVVADGPTDQVLNNKRIIENSSMILPQVSEFKLALERIGIKCPTKITSEQQIITFLSDYLKQNIKN